LRGRAAAVGAAVEQRCSGGVSERAEVVATRAYRPLLYLQTKKMQGDHQAVGLLDGRRTRFTD